MRQVLTGIGLVVSIAFSPAVPADDFAIEFEWGDFPRCTTGSPKQVENPVFTLSNVPEGTAEIRFRMKDRNAPGYRHGGGKVAYSGQSMIEPGAFKYASPCPPMGKHTYEWTATAVDGNGDTLAKAKARKKYP